MNAEFNWWLLIVGLVVGAGLVWLVLADSRRRDADVTELERDGEAQWIAVTMRDAGRHVDEADVLDVLRLHAAYLSAAPPDEPSNDPSDEPPAAEVEPLARRQVPSDRDQPDIDDDRRDADRWTPVPERSPVVSASDVRADGSNTGRP